MNPKLPPQPMPKHSKPIPFAAIESRIHLVRNTKVMLDADLAELYGVATGHLNRAVRRNIERFPDDFMRQLSAEEAANLKCQIGTSSLHGGRRHLPYAFTQEGIAMLSSAGVETGSLYGAVHSSSKVCGKRQCQWRARQRFSKSSDRCSCSLRLYQLKRERTLPPERVAPLVLRHQRADC
jgi:hypothetical protein